MKFKSFLRVFGSKRRTKRADRPTRRPSRLALEHLEKRELLSNDAPRILSVLPPDGSTTTSTQPVMAVTFSEDVIASQAQDPTNYQLFNSEGQPVPIVLASYDTTAHRVTLTYNAGPLGLPANTYSLFVRGDHIHDVDDGLPLAQPKQLIVANAGTQNVSLVNMPGNGTLQALTNYADGGASKPAAVALADINGDGIPDLVVANAGTDTVEVFNGQGPGVFAGSPSVVLGLPTRAAASGLVVDDFNADGKMDIAVADSGTNQVSVFINNGVAGFKPRADYAVGRTPIAIVSADFDGDGRKDLAVADSGQDFANRYDVSVLLQDPVNAGKFLNAQSFDTGLVTPTAMAAGDVNQDNRPDLVVAASNGARILSNVSSGHGVASFIQGSILTTTPTNGIAIGNVDSDPRVDIVATTKSNNGQALVFQSLGSGFFSSPTAFAIGGTPSAVAVADVNGDLKNDILITTQGTPNSLTVLRNISTPTLVQFSAPFVYPVDAGPVALALHMTNNVVDEVATADSLGNDVSILRTGAAGNFLVSTELSTLADVPAAVVVGDLNGDHIPDLVVATTPSASSGNFRDSIQIYLSQPGGGYAAPQSFPVGLNFGSQPLGLTLGDLSGTGNQDIIVTNPNDFTISIIANNGNGTFTSLQPIQLNSEPATLAVGDFNGDGHNDIAVGLGGFFTFAQGVDILTNLGNRTFTAPQQISTTIPVAAMAAADLDMDGKTDLVIADGQSAGNVEILHNTSSSTAVSFSILGPFGAGSHPEHLAVADINRDGFPDVVVTNHTDAIGGVVTDSVSVLLNNGLTGAANGFLPSPIKTDVLANTTATFQSILVTDVNQDLFPDVVVSTTSGTPNNVITLLGLGRGMFGPPTFYGASGGGAASPSYLAVSSNAFIRATTFTVAGPFVGADLIKNGTFDVADLNQETGNLVAWQQVQETDSHGAWMPQTGTVSPLSGLPVLAPPQGQYAAMLDQPDVVSPLGVPYYLNIPGADVFDGSHVLYQDFFIPSGVTQATLSLQLYLNNTAGAFSDPTVTPSLDYFPGQVNRPANQQVRIDIMDPTANPFDVGAGVLTNIYQTTPQTNPVFGGYLTITADLSAFKGRVVRLRIAEVNNQGRLIVGVDNVHVQSFFVDNTTPSLNGVRLRNPGFGATATFGGNTTDPTIIGQVSDMGSPNNIAYIEIDPTNTGFNNADDYFLIPGRNGWDAQGDFVTTLPTLLPSGDSLLPGPITIGIRAVSRGGQAVATTFTFNFEGPSLTAWQAMGPGTIRYTGQGVNFNVHGESTVSGNITAIIADPSDTSGNSYYVGSDNGGVWKTTDGGNNWTPLTDFVTDPVLGNVYASISSLAIEAAAPLTLYAATGVANNEPTSRPGYGILKTVNGGQTWTVVGRDVFVNARISKVAVAPNGWVYAGVASGGKFGPGVYISQDGGQTWTNTLTPATMNLDRGGTVPAGTALASVTDVEVDIFHPEKVWIGLGNLGLLTPSTTAGVWLSTNGGTTWQQIVGGHDPKNAVAVVRNQTLPPGPGSTQTDATKIGKVLIALPTGRPSDEGIVYVMMVTAGSGNPLDDGTSLNEKGDTLANSDDGIYKTSNNGLSWTHVMIREDVPIQNNLRHFVNLFMDGHEANDVGSLVVDPNNANVFYVGGSRRFLKASDFVNPNFSPPDHALIRVDTSDMRDTNYASPFYPTTPGPIYPNDGDDILKVADAAFNAAGTNGPIEPGSYPMGSGAGGYTGEGVFWYDLQTGDYGQRFFNVFGQAFGGLQLPGTINTLAFDARGRLLVGTKQGIWRGTSQGFTYDTTSGGTGVDSIPGKLSPGNPTPAEGGMTFTDLNGNLQIADMTSVAIDPYNRNVLHSSMADTGWAQTNSGLTWQSTNDIVPNFGFGEDIADTFAAYAGPVRIGPADPSAPPGTLSTVYRSFSFVVVIPDQVEKSTQGGVQGTFGDATNGLSLSNVIDTTFLPLAVNPSKVTDASGRLQDELLFFTNQIFESDNSGGIWDPTGRSLPDVATALAFGPSGNDVYYVGTRSGRVFITLNDGRDGFPEKDQGLPRGQQVNGITVDPNNPSIAYVMYDGFGTHSHVFRTTDGGATWKDITGNLPDVPAYSMVIDPRPSSGYPTGKIYLGNGVGVYTTADTIGTAAPTWTRLGAVTGPNGQTLFTLPNVPVRDLQFNQNFEEIVAATQGRGAFEISTDHIGPHIVAVNPSTPVSPGFSAVTVTFNKPVDPRTFTLSQIPTFIGPNGPITPLSIRDVDPSTHQSFQITFLPQVLDGNYTLSVGPNIQDFLGNPMDQNGDGIGGENPGDIFTVQFAVNTTDNGRFITGVYHDVLGRAADTTGFLALLGQIDAPRFKALNQIALGIASSDEGRTNTILGIYHALLGSNYTPTQAQLSSALAAIKAGASYEQLISAIVDSPAYFQKAGSTDLGFITSLYQDVLGRPVDQAALADFLNRAEIAPRTAIVNAIDHSTEYLTDLVKSFYTDLLPGHNPTATEVAAWVNLLQSGITDEQVIAAFVASDEYFANAGGTNARWLSAAYNDVLGRNPDANAIAGFLPRLNDGTLSRGTVAAMLLGSGEYKADLLTKSTHANPKAYYPTYLNRQPSTAELNFWVGVLLQGVPDEAVISSFVASGENFQINGTGATQSTKDTSWLASTFQSLLGRPVDPAAQSASLSLMASAEQSARDLYSLVLPSSDEYRASYVTKEYRILLQRLPGTSEITFWVSFLKGPAPGAGQPNLDEQFVAGLVSSVEFFFLQRDVTTGLATNTSWIVGLYVDVLGRAPDQAGLNANLLAILGAYQPQRLGVAQTLIQSLEYRQDLARSFYLTYLRRAASPNDVNTLAPLLENSVTDEQVLIALLASNEYFQNPNLGASSNSVWLNQVFLDLLKRNRDPSSQGLLDGLNNGTLTRAQVVSAVIGTEDYRDQLITSDYAKFLGRTPAPSEITYWSGRLQGGLTDEQFVTLLLSSAEYYLRTHQYP
jgi:hypothetical protein